jgi:hypothetical protein
LQRAGFGILPKQSFWKLGSKVDADGKSKPEAYPFGKVRDREDALASTRDACATPEIRLPILLNFFTHSV